MSAIILVAIVAVPQWLSKGARLEVLRDHVGQIADLAASVVDGDLHAQLIDPANYSKGLYDRALKPLVRFHSANPEIFYVYTMVERDGGTFFVLDTAASPDLHVGRNPARLRTWRNSRSARSTRATGYSRSPRAQPGSRRRFSRTTTGDFLTAHKAIFDSQHRYAGFVGVDFDLQYYLSQEARFQRIGTWSLIAALVASLIIGYIIALYHFDLNHRLEEHYHTSIRDGLTGLLNRRGAIDAIRRSLARRTASYATLLVDIDNLKALNDTGGHAHGDAVIAALATVICESIREGDDCARLGGDEFMIFAPDCDAVGAAEIARRILAATTAPCGELAGSSFSVSIGIAVRDHADADFDRMYREADAALYHAKSGGKHRFSYYEATVKTQTLPA
ncbi:MAG: GGDEF domain-containing protein [Gammaproteobacteria bacterium]